jgi:hypothetical protein
VSVETITNKTELVRIIDTTRDKGIKSAAIQRLATLIANGFRVGNAHVNDSQVQICTDLRFAVDTANALVGFNCNGAVRWNRPFMMHRFCTEMIKWMDMKEIANERDEIPFFHIPAKPDASTKMGLSSDRFVFTWQCIDNCRALFVAYLTDGIGSLRS